MKDVIFTIGELEISSPSVPARFFVGNPVMIKPTFKGDGILGGTFTFPGTAPLEIIAPSGAAGPLTGGALTLGPEPTSYQVKTSVLPKVLEVRAFALSELQSLLVEVPATVRPNSLFKVKVLPQHAGNTIGGKPPSPFTLESTSAVPIRKVSAQDYEQVIEATSVGTLNLRVTWGPVVKDVVIQIMQ